MGESIRQGLRDAGRALRRTPGAATVVVLILGLGIGANATMFDLVDRLLLRPPDHVVGADRLRLLQADRPTLTNPRFARNQTYPDIEDIRHLPALEAVSAFTRPRQMTLGRGADARQVQVQLAEASYFATLGVRPALGRFYGAGDDAPGAALTAVVSEAFWRDALGGDARIVGRSLEIGARRYDVVGVAPRGFTGADLARVDVWLPLPATMMAESGARALTTRTWWWANAIVRLKPGVTDATANAQMTTAHVAARREVERQGGEAYLSKGPARLYSVSIVTGRRPNPSATTSVAFCLAGVSGIVLLIACANVANILLARGLETRRELAVRAALGAGRGRLIGLVLAEAAMLTAAGTATAVVVSRWTGAAARSYFPDIVFDGAGLGGRLMVFSAGVALLTVTLAGAMPAIQAARTSAIEALRSGGRGSSLAGTRLRHGLVIVQTMLSVVLLVGAGLFVRSMTRAAGAELGFDHAHLVVATIEGQSGVRGARRDAIYYEALARVAAAPGVRRAALAIEPTIAFGGWSGPGGIQVPGGDVIDDLPDGGPFLYAGTAGFFETLGVPTVRGRSFVAADDVDGAEPVGMVSATFARTVWPGREAVGQCFRMGADAPDEPRQPCRRVVGVFGDFVRSAIGDTGTIAVAVPSRPERKSPQALVARVDGDVAAALPRLRAIVLGVSPDVRFVRVEAMADRYDDQLEPWRLGATMFVAFGGLALAVATVGLYGCLTFTVAGRRRELGIRSALGAQRRALTWLVVRQAGALLAAGLVGGVALALAAGRVVGNLLFDVTPRDPLVHVAVVGVLGAAGLLATLAPSWRAATVDPASTLRAD